MNVSEHMRCAKQKALALLEDGDVSGAYASIVSDLRGHPAIELGVLSMVGGPLGDPLKMKEYIEGFA